MIPMASAACNMNEIVREILKAAGDLVRRKGLSVHVLGNLHERLPLDRDSLFTLLSRLLDEAATNAPCNTMVTITSGIDEETRAWTCSVEHLGHGKNTSDDRLARFIDGLHVTLARGERNASPGMQTVVTVPLA